MIQIKIIRHSERLDYSKPLYWLLCFGHYWADSPLTSNGHRIANAKGKTIATQSEFNPKHIYTSPYNRTMATATEIKDSFPHSEIVIEPLLAEYQPLYKHRINLYPEGIPTTYDGQETDFSYPEPYEHFESRVKFIISKLIEKHNEDFVVVTHGEVLKTYINYLQTMFPDLMLDPGTTPYLTILSFSFDKDNNRIDENTVRLE